MKVFRCPNCKDVMFRQKRELKNGDRLNSANLECIQGHKDNERLICRKCKYHLNYHNFVRPENWIEEGC